MITNEGNTMTHIDGGIAAQGRDLTPAEVLVREQADTSAHVYDDLRARYTQAQDDVNALTEALRSAQLRTDVLGASLQYLDAQQPDLQAKSIAVPR